MADQEMIDKVKAELTRLIEPAVNPKAPYAIIMLDEMAKVAIKAMLEPTQKMVDAGINVGEGLGWGCYFSNYKNAYQAMINAVINE